MELRADIRLKASVIHEWLADGHGFTGNYQRVKMYVAEARPRIAGAGRSAGQPRGAGAAPPVRGAAGRRRRSTGARSAAR